MSVVVVVIDHRSNKTGYRSCLQVIGYNPQVAMIGHKSHILGHVSLCICHISNKTGYKSSDKPGHNQQVVVISYMSYVLGHRSLLVIVFR